MVQAVALALKPCCLPIARHAVRNEIWTLGGHRIQARQVCGIPGKWKGNTWYGCNREALKPFFVKWADGLFHGADIGGDRQAAAAAAAGKNSGGRRRLVEYCVQPLHFQNLFVFAERPPMIGGCQPCLR